MFRLFIILSAVCIAVAVTFGSLEVLNKCVETYTNKTSNEYMTGTWYAVYKFTLFGVLTPTCVCPNHTFSIPTAEELKIYKDKYDSAGYPFTLNEKSLLSEPNKGNNAYYNLTQYKIKGMYSSDAEAKYWVLDPRSVLRNQGYNVYVYKEIDQNYMEYWDCSLRGHVKWLMSRKKNPPQEEILAIIDSHPELKHLEKQRFCAPKLSCGIND